MLIEKLVALYMGRSRRQRGGLEDPLENLEIVGLYVRPACATGHLAF